MLHQIDHESLEVQKGLQFLGNETIFSLSAPEFTELNHRSRGGSVVFAVFAAVGLFEVCPAVGASDNFGLPVDSKTANTSPKLKQKVYDETRGKN